MSAPALTLAFDDHNRLALRFTPLGREPADGAPLPGLHPSPFRFELRVQDSVYQIALGSLVGAAPLTDTSILFYSLAELARTPAANTPLLAALLPALDPYLIQLPYLHLGENDFIYKFRPAQERNTAIYAQDAASSALYQSALCTAIKALARRHERSATEPVALDFGAVRYLLPSHFGFCLGVKNAIERAYETLAENPGRRVFMLSELIHNSFVNDDLLRRGLRYLQSDKGVPFTVSGAKAAHGTASPADPLLWDQLTPDDIVIIPAFGATDDDKRRLVRQGLAVFAHDATCMLVEKVWKAARAYGREGYTVIIHGKHEHEETKATFANTRRHAPSLIVRNLAETRALAALLPRRADPAAQAEFEAAFAGRHTEGFSVARDLERVAVVNQTTLLVNETREIAAYLREAYLAACGPDPVGTPARVGGQGRNDTLCYATQVNQDALGRALAGPLDAAFVIGGRNSSNTYQLHRLCEERLGAYAFFIQSEADIHSLTEVAHYVFPSRGPGGASGHTELRPLWPGETFARPRRILITGGASCPDGLIQAVITRINTLFPADLLRPISAVLTELETR
ncbi:MAG: 4-hydroxy-3-methylbut-2-enyl diphosphate reductase [Verrucomicrobia bacterium]|nr:4-hydroxy-3-methylbut-2-enyl diphosphate reductase [Verrucomicrobiota bacterium]